MNKVTIRFLLAAAITATAGNALADVCSSLQQQYLAAGSGNASRASVDVAALNRSLQAAQASAQQNHCTGFTLFGPRPAPYCNLIMQEVGRLQTQIRAASYAGGGGGGVGGMFGYADARSPKDQARDMLVAKGCSVPQTGNASAGGYKTLCVRTCDGYYFPIETGVSSARFQADAQTCSAMYGDPSKAQIYAVPSDGDVATATPVGGGKPYGSQPFAFSYRQNYDAACIGQLQTGMGTLANRVSSPLPGAAPVVAAGPPMPIPQLRPSRFEDPETLANAAGGLHPAIVAVAAADVRTGEVRVVGAGYYNAILDQQAAETRLRSVPASETPAAEATPPVTTQDSAAVSEPTVGARAGAAARSGPPAGVSLAAQR